MKFRWYNPMSWGFFSYEDPNTGKQVEVDLVGGGRRTKAGVTVTPAIALSNPIIWSSIKILSETVSGLPLKLYDDSGERRVLVKSQGRELRLLRKPNPYMTRLNFLKAVVVNMALRGNAYAVISRSDKDAIGFSPVSPDCVSMDTDAAGDPFYWVQSADKTAAVSPENMLHFKLFSRDGVTGLSPIEHMSETIGLAKAAQDWASKFMQKGGVTGGYIVFKEFLTEEQQAQVMRKFPDIRQDNVDSLGKWGLIQGGPQIVPAGLSQKDAQFIETQKFQEEALAGIWGVPLFLANRASATSIQGSNLEQQIIAFITFGMKPYIDAIEDEFNDKVYGVGTGSRFVEFIVDGLLRMDSEARMRYFQAALGGNNSPGWMSQDEVREKENLPLQGGEYSRVLRWEKNANAQQT